MLSRITYAISGATYAIPFGFLSRAHLEVYVDSTLKTIITDFTIASGGASLTFKVGGVTTTPTGTNVIIKRVTPTTQFVDFSDGSRVTEENLDNALLQSLYLAEEAQDENTLKLGLDDASVYWDADSKQIKNVDDPTAAQDAATKAYVDATAIADGNVVAPVNPTDDGKVLTASGGSWLWSAISIAAASISDITWLGIRLLTATSQAEVRALAGAQPAGSYSHPGHVHAYADITNPPASSSFNPIANQVFGG